MNEQRIAQPARPRLIYLLLLALLLAACGGSSAAQPTSAPAAAEPTSAPAAAAPTSAPAAAEPTSAPAAAEPTSAPASARVTDTPAAAQPTTAAAPAPKNITIKLAENPWTGSSVNVNVAKILLEEQLGYKVEIVTIDENAQWPALAKGDLSASLEVWPSGHAEDAKKYIEGVKQVEDIGKLGAVGRIGWYIPTYLLTDHPELKTWEGFKKPENAALFKTAETGEKGQFLQGDPSWVYYDADIIKNLGMDFQIVQTGSEDSMFAAVDAAYSRKQPVVFYYWSPNWAFAKYDFTKVELPKYSEECYAKAKEGGVACDYPEDVLYKIAWSGLKDAAPEAYQLLKNMNYTNDDQVSMIGDVVLQKKSSAEAARAWIEKNPDKWKAWLPK
jgi:glycine betaine/proline transport system substrate-binding protein